MTKCRKEFIFFGTFLLFFITPLFLRVFAQTADPISSSLLLQATQNVTNNGPSVWQNMLPVALEENQTLPIDMSHLTVVNDPTHTVFLPSSDSNSSSVNQSALLQASTSIPFQETSSSSVVDQLFSSKAFTFPVTHGEITVNTASQTLSNKTLSATSNTISGLTNANLSGSAGITNANLANSTIMINSGTGISGGASVSLGGSLTLTNAGVTSLTGTVNQVNLSGSTGGITLSLPQSINNSANPTFSSLNLTNTANQLVLGTTNTGILNWSPTASRTLTFPDVTDTLIGKATTDTLTNKTLTSPVINGTVTTTGLTLPAFTASGTITGSGNPTITNFGSINGLTLASASDGFTFSGGTSIRTLTMTGGDLTLGSTIKPTYAGALTVQSNGANVLNLDSGGNAGINIGTTNASSITLGTDATVSANKTFSVTTADKLTVGGTIIPQSIPILVPLSATVVTQPVFIADTTYQVTGAKCIPSIISVSGTFQVTVESGTTAAGSGTSQLSSTISLSGTANTVVSGALIGLPTTINAGDRISAKFGGVLTGLLGNCTIYLKRV